MIRVLLADDDVLVRSGLRALLDAEEDITVVGEAADGREAVDRARTLLPDVVLMDVRMPRLDGVAATREIVSWPRRPRVLVLTTFDLDEVVDDALDAGADGFLLKRATPEQLIDGIRTVVAGDALVAPAVTRRLLAAYAARRAPDRDRLRMAAHLTEREADILRALADGLSNAEIAREVWLSPETVKTHVKSILAKLGRARPHPGGRLGLPDGVRRPVGARARGLVGAPGVGAQLGVSRRRRPGHESP